MKPKVSIVMGVWNGGTKLKASIDSILVQTHTDFEFVIVDDTSTDTTPEILREYASKDSRIKIITNEQNLGLTKSLNVGICASRGTYIAHMDSGDTSEPTRFAQQVAFLDTHPDYGLVGAWTYLIDDVSQRIGTMKYPTDDDSLKKMLIKHNGIVHSSVMIRRSLLDTAGIYNEAWKYAQDYELFLRLSQYTKIANIADYLVSYRMTAVSITSKKNKEQVLFAIRARQGAIKRGQYPWWNRIYLIEPWIGYVVPYLCKQKIKRLFHI